MEHYLEHGSVEQEEICRMTAERKVFPCFFGSALKIEGVAELLNGLAAYSRELDYPEAFGAIRKHLEPKSLRSPGTARGTG